MTTAAQSIIKDVQVNNLTDPTGTRWPASVLVEHLNWAQRMIAATRWDLTAASATLTLIAGHAQNVDALHQGIIEILSLASGTRAALRQVKREDLDAIEPNWRSLAQSAAIEHYIYDPRHPRRFDVYPPATVGTQLSAIVSAYPLDVAAPTAPGLVYTTVTGNIALPDNMAPALSSLVTFRAYMKDAEYAANTQLAGMHLQAAVGLVGKELEAMINATPSTREDASK